MSETILYRCPQCDAWVQIGAHPDDPTRCPVGHALDAPLVRAYRLEVRLDRAIADVRAMDLASLPEAGG